EGGARRAGSAAHRAQRQARRRRASPHRLRPEEERLRLRFLAHCAANRGGGIAPAVRSIRARLRDDTPVTEQARPSRTSFFPPPKKETAFERVTRDFRGMIGHVAQTT